MRIRFVLPLLVAGLLFAAGIASAQDTTTEPTSGYTSTTPTVTTPAETTTTEAAPETSESAPAAAGEAESGSAPAAAGESASEAPSTLAFTGGEPLLLIALGVVLAGGTAALLLRDRRRSQHR